MKKKLERALRIACTGGLVVAVAVAMSGLLSVNEASAAALTSKSDTITRLQDNTASNHTIQFTTPTGVAAAGTITITFPAGFNMNTLNYLDLDLKDDTVDLVLAATPSGTTWGAVLAGQVITFTNGSAVVAAGSVIEIQIGTNATEPTTGDTQITNPDIATDTTYEIALTAGASDSGQLEVQILMDDSVNVTATVDEAISFAISDTTIGFGDLSASTGRWATADAAGGNATGGSEPTTAHTLSIGTNATGGYAITYSGATLTSGANTITDAATINDDSDGTPGGEQFGISASRSGDATIASGYQKGPNSDWDFVVSTATTLVSETVPTATETISVSYLGNIATTTESGSYSTDITYVATATF